MYKTRESITKEGEENSIHRLLPKNRYVCSKRSVGYES